MMPSILEGATKQGSKHFVLSTRGKFALISQPFFRAPMAPYNSHKLSSLLHGVITFTNSSLRPTRSAKQTFFDRNVGLVGKVLFCCVSVFMPAVSSEGLEGQQFKRASVFVPSSDVDNRETTIS